MVKYKKLIKIFKKFLFCCFFLIEVLIFSVFLQKTYAEEYISCSSEPTDMFITYGNLINCSIEFSGDSDIFKFDGSKGEQIIIQTTWQSGALRPCIELVAPDNTRTKACQNSFSNTIDTTLNQTGTYSIIVKDWFSTSYGNYVLVLERIIPPSFSAQVIQYSETIQDEINIGGDIDLFRFEGSNGDIISLTTTWQSGALRPCIELVAPDNTRTKACQNSFSNTIDTTLNQTGTYSIIVKDWFSTSYGNYSITLQCLSGRCIVYPEYLISIIKSGSGSGIVISIPDGIDCGSDCFESYPFGTVVALIAIPDAGSTFTGWSGGGCSGTGTCIITMNANKSIAATFESSTIKYNLTISKGGSGSGIGVSSPSGINCGSDCSEQYDQGTVVALTAIPDAGSTFTGWSGGGCSGTGTCIITMNANTSVTATFHTPLPKPDLTGQWIFLTQVCKIKKVGMKCKIKGTINIQNNGNLHARSSFVAYYLSNDNTYDNNDTFLKQVTTGKVKAGKNKNKNLRYSFPTGESATGKYVIAIIDAGNIIDETNEWNNIIAYGPIQ